MITWRDWITEDRLKLLKNWARSGMTDEQIAERIGIQRPTIYSWKKKSADIDNALKKGKEVYDYEMEDALYLRGQGQWIEEEKQIVYFTDSGERRTRIEKMKRYIPPDTGALIFWLKNRKPEEWRDKRETQVSGELKTNAFDELTADELRKLINDD